MSQQETDQSDPPATMGDMQQAVGALFMLWSGVEANLANALEELSDQQDKDKPHGIRRTLASWRALHDGVASHRRKHIEVVEALHMQLHEALKVRNFIAHGLEGYGIARSDGSGEAHFRCRLKDEAKVITLEHLKDCLRLLAGAEAHISRLTYAAMHPGELGLQSLYEDILDLMQRRT